MPSPASAPARAPTAAYAHERMRALADADNAAFLQRYFKTGPGQYGEGDRFLGIRIPALRKLARELRGLPLVDAAELLGSPFHEERGLALMLLVDAYERGGEPEREAIYRLYLRSTAHVNNWDLVDSSAPGIVGAHLAGRDRAPLLELARSSDLWERRIAMVATLHLIRRGEVDETQRIARELLGDRHDLIHKAAGWMLREMGKRDIGAVHTFLREHAHEMPRTMLRYAIERLPEPMRRRYMTQKQPAED
ncbi:MAG TPA: DNA alkylation repair protein [Longimicrobiaceae bacterium]|nr:DNA alkylation repair protein [Longimicrobiaceae bacterium]